MNDTERFEKFAAQTLDPRALVMPEVAQGSATREVLHMADLVTNMLELCVQPILDFERPAQTRIQALENQVDELNAAILGYLIQLDEEAMTEEQQRWDRTLL